jgi:hypothetical protein
MTKEQLESLVERIRALAPEKLDECADFLDWLEVRGEATYILSAEERADLSEALREMDRGEVATQGEVDAVFRRRG